MEMIESDDHNAPRPPRQRLHPVWQPLVSALSCPAMAPLLRVSDLSHWRDGRPVLRGISFGLNRGEIVGLLGVNGAGKSTCLEILSGNLAPVAGRVEIDGTDLAREPLLAKRRLGYLPERAPLYPEMRVDEYLGFCATLHGVGRRQVDAAVATAKRRCGLSQVGARLIRKLSKGYRQRVGVAQATVHRPAILILDEPTEGLDPLQIQEMRRLVEELRGECGIIFASHLLSEVQALCTRVQVLNAGQLVYHCAMGDESRASERPLKLTLARPATAEQLLGLRGVVGARSRGRPTQWEVRLAADAAVERLAEQLVVLGLGLRELAVERPSLEQTFLDILSRDPAP